MPAKPAPLLCVDGPSLMYRAWFGLPDTITDGQNRPVNALLGTTNLILRTIAAYAPRAVMFCDGAEAAHYRKAAYPPYHSGRPDTPEGLVWQFQQAPTFFNAFGWGTTVTEELEADDLLGAYASAETANGGNTFIYTGDRDMFQCVTANVHVLYPQKGQDGPARITPEKVIERYGVSPEQVPDFIALRGDPSDGIPGAKGIGEKTAASLLRVHGDLEGVLAQAEAQKPRVAKALQEQAEELRMFRHLATLQPIEVTPPPDCPTDLEGGARAAEAHGMRTLAERLRS
jgi:DNA polymerase-1